MIYFSNRRNEYLFSLNRARFICRDDGIACCGCISNTNPNRQIYYGQKRRELLTFSLINYKHRYVALPKIPHNDVI